MNAALNLPQYSFTFRQYQGKNQIFDQFRKKYITLTPEEWVRQNFLQWLTSEKKIPKSLIAVEKTIVVSNLTRRYDAVVFNKDHHPVMLIEFKAPEVKIAQHVFEQAARYNLKLKVPYLVISNGLNHYCCKLNLETQQIEFLKDIPEFGDLIF